MEDLDEEPLSDVTEAMVDVDPSAPPIRLGVRPIAGAADSDSVSDDSDIEDDSDVDEAGEEAEPDGDPLVGEEEAAAQLGLADEDTMSVSDMETDSDPDEEQHQKLDDEERQSFLDIFHPEAKVQNFEEVRLKATVKRDKDGRIVDPEHQTLPHLTRYELTRVLGVRAHQLNGGATPLVDVPPDVLDGYTIAEAELAQKKIPFIIRRPLPGGTSEFWRLEDLELLRAPAELGLEQARRGSSTSTGSRS